MSDAEDLTGPYLDEDGNAIDIIAPCLVDRCWMDDGDYHRSAGAIAHWTRIPDKPSPPLPWVEHPRAWWQHVDGNGDVYRSADMAFTISVPACWQRVAVIPWDLIEDLRALDRDGGVTTRATEAILDAADGA